MMKVRVRVFGDAAEVLGGKHVLEVEEGATVGAVLREVQRRAGAPRPGFVGSFRLGGPDMAVIVNGVNSSLLQGLETVLKDGDEVVVMPYVVGG